MQPSSEPNKTPYEGTPFDSYQTVKDKNEPGACSTCGFPEDTPGYIREPYEVNTTGNRLIPCPDCHSSKSTERLKKTGQMEGELRNYTFQNYAITDLTTEAYTAALEYVLKPRGYFTLWGDYGPGKTHLLAAIANELGPGRSRYYTMPDLASTLRNDARNIEKVYDQLNRIEVLIIDEIDKAHLKDWTREQSHRIFDFRYRNIGEYGLVMAMNHSPIELDDSIQFLAHRMMDSRFNCIHITGSHRERVESVRELARLQND